MRADLTLVARCFHLAKLVELGLLDRRIDHQRLGRLLRLHLELVDPDYNQFSLLDHLLVAVRAFLDLLLDVPSFDGSQGSAHAVNRIYICEGALLYLVCERFRKIRPSQRVDAVGHAALVRYYLLGSERYQHGLLGWEGERLVP